MMATAPTLGACEGPSDASLDGVQLGMSPADVRGRFARDVPIASTLRTST